MKEVRVRPSDTRVEKILISKILAYRMNFVPPNGGAEIETKFTYDPVVIDRRRQPVSRVPQIGDLVNVVVRGDELQGIQFIDDEPVTPKPEKKFDAEVGRRFKTSLYRDHLCHIRAFVDDHVVFRYWSRHKQRWEYRCEPKWVVEEFGTPK